MVKLIKICPVIPRDQSVFILSSFSYSYLKIDYVHLAKILGKIILFHLGMFLDSTGIGRAPTAFRRLRLRKNAQF